MAPVTVILMASSAIRVTQQVEQELVRKAAVVWTGTTPGLWSTPSIPPFRRTCSLHEVEEVARVDRVVQEAFLPSEDKAVTAVWGQFVLVLSFPEMVVRVDQAGAEERVVGVVSADEAATVDEGAL
jgi:hypothetical protein